MSRAPSRAVMKTDEWRTDACPYCHRLGWTQHMENCAVVRANEILDAKSGTRSTKRDATLRQAVGADGA